MTARLLGLAWALLLFAGMARRRHLRRRPALTGGSRSAHPDRRRPTTMARSACAAVGRQVSAVVPGLGHGARPEVVGAAVLSVSLVAVVRWPVAPVVAIGWLVVPWWHRRRRAARRHAAVVDEVPDVVDLFRLAAGAGSSVRLAVEAVGERSRGVVGEALDEVVRQVGLGRRLADALDRLRDLGEPVRPLVDALQASERYGVPLGPSLTRVADEARRLRRRRAEEAARRVPVKLLFPLVLCTLPAFGLLTVVPLLVGAFRAIAW